MSYDAYSIHTISLEEIKKEVPMQFMILQGLLDDYNVDYEELACCVEMEDSFEGISEEEEERIFTAYRAVVNEFMHITGLRIDIEYFWDPVNSELLHDGTWTFTIDPRTIYAKTPEAERYERKRGYSITNETIIVDD